MGRTIVRGFACLTWSRTWDNMKDTRGVQFFNQVFFSSSLLNKKMIFPKNPGSQYQFRIQIWDCSDILNFSRSSGHKKKNTGLRKEKKASLLLGLAWLPLQRSLNPGSAALWLADCSLLHSSLWGWFFLQHSLNQVL